LLVVICNVKFVEFNRGCSPPPFRRSGIQPEPSSGRRWWRCAESNANYSKTGIPSRSAQQRMIAFLRVPSRPAVVKTPSSAPTEANMQFTARTALPASSRSDRDAGKRYEFRPVIKSKPLLLRSSPAGPLAGARSGKLKYVSETRKEICANYNARYSPRTIAGNSLILITRAIMYGDWRVGRTSPNNDRRRIYVACCHKRDITVIVRYLSVIINNFYIAIISETSDKYLFGR